MGGEWGVGSSLAMEKTPKDKRGIVSGLLQEGYAAGNLLAALCFFFVFPRWGWRPMFFIGGIPALLALYVRTYVQESEVWERTRHRDFGAYARDDRVALEAASLPVRLHDADGLRVARNAGHVSDVPQARLALHAAARRDREHHRQLRRDRRRHARSDTSPIARAAARQSSRALVLAIWSRFPLWAFAPTFGICSSSAAC